MRIQKSPGRAFVEDWTSVSDEGKWLDITFSAFERITAAANLECGCANLT
jgi:hypothetical protein